MSHIELAKDLYDAFGRKDEARLRELLHPEVEWIQCAGFPGGGHRHGVDEVLAKVFGALRSEWRDWRVEVDEILDAGDAVVVLGKYTGTHGETGRAMEAVFAHVYDVAGGRITRFRQFADTVPLVAAAPHRDPGQVSSDIYPGLSYDDAPAAIDWLCRAFGFRKRLVVPGPDGTVRHSELSLGPVVIMVGSSRPDAGRISPRGLSAVSQALSVRVEDPDAHFARAKAAGAEILQGLEDADYGSRGYMAKDLEGHQWYFGTYRPGAHWGDEPE